MHYHRAMTAAYATHLHTHPPTHRPRPPPPSHSALPPEKAAKDALGAMTAAQSGDTFSAFRIGAGWFNRKMLGEKKEEGGRMPHNADVMASLALDAGHITVSGAAEP